MTLSIPDRMHPCDTFNSGINMIGLPAANIVDGVFQYDIVEFLQRHEKNLSLGFAIGLVDDRCDAPQARVILLIDGQLAQVTGCGAGAMFPAIMCAVQIRRTHTCQAVGQMHNLAV